MWCPISQSTCHTSTPCSFKAKKDSDKCLFVEALKVYIETNTLLKAYSDKDFPKNKKHN